MPLDAVVGATPVIDSIEVVGMVHFILTGSKRLLDVELVIPLLGLCVEGIGYDYENTYKHSAKQPTNLESRLLSSPSSPTDSKVLKKLNCGPTP